MVVDVLTDQGAVQDTRIILQMGYSRKHFVPESLVISNMPLPQTCLCLWSSESVPTPFSYNTIVDVVKDCCEPWNKTGKHCFACASLITKYPIVQSMIHHLIFPYPV